MRRKSERNKSKSTSDKKPAETSKKSRRSSRRRKRSTSHSSSEDSDDAPLKPAVSEPQVVAEISHPPDGQKVTESRSNSDEDKQEEQPVWKVKTSEVPSGEIQKLKICLQRPPTTPERVEKSPRRRRGQASSQSDDASLTPEEKPRKKKSRKDNPVATEGSSLDNSVIEEAEKDECLMIVQETNEVVIGKGKLDCSHPSQESENEECIQDSRTETQADESLTESKIEQDMGKPIIKDICEPQEQQSEKNNVEESIQTIENSEIHYTKNTVDETTNVEQTSLAVQIEDSTEPEETQNQETISFQTNEENSSERVQYESVIDSNLFEVQEGTIIETTVIEDSSCTEITAQIVKETSENQSTREVSHDGQNTSERFIEEQNKSEVPDVVQIQVEQSCETIVVNSKHISEGPEVILSEIELPKLEMEDGTSKIQEESPTPSSETGIKEGEIGISDFNSNQKEDSTEAKSSEVEEESGIENHHVNTNEDSSKEAEKIQTESIPSEEDGIKSSVEEKSDSPDVKEVASEIEDSKPTSPDNQMEEDSPERMIRRRNWGKYSATLKEIPAITFSVVSSFCPSLKMLKLDDVKLEIEEPKPIKKEREVTIPFSPKEEDSEKEVSNIGLNRKISIVNDEASKLQPPPSPAKNPVSPVLYITNLVRPFTVKQLQELLSRTGKIVEDGFWTDRIKSKCYVQYETEEEAEATRNALHGVQWPIGNGKKLLIDFGTQESMTAAKNAVAEPPAPKLAPDKAVDKMPEYKKEEPIENDRWEKARAAAPIREWDVGKIPHDRRDRSRSRDRNHSRSDRTDKKRAPRIESPSNGDHLSSRKKRKEEPEVKMMDDLFHKTKATPSIYWLPLSPEQIAKKQQQRLQRMAEHKRRMEESRRMDRDFGRGAPRSRRRMSRYDAD